MITTHCTTCGGTFKLDDAFAGRRVKCQRCHSVFVVPEADPFTRDDTLVPLHDEDDLLPEAPPEGGQQPARTDWVDPNSPIVLDLAAKPTATAEAHQAPGKSATAPTRSLLGDLGATIRYPLNIRGATIIGAFCLLNLLARAARAFGGFGSLIMLGFMALSVLMYGVLYGFYMAVVSETCRGEDELPGAGLDIAAGGVGRGAWLDVLEPLLKYLGTYLWAWLPLIGFLFAHLAFGPIVDGRTALLIGIGLLLLGAWLWPIIVLTSVLSDSSASMLRYDLHLISTLRTLPDYLLVFIGVVLARTVEIMAWVLLLFAKSIPWLDGWLGAIVAPVASIYTSIVAMRLIGLLYRHAKGRLAWVAE